MCARARRQDIEPPYQTYNNIESFRVQDYPQLSNTYRPHEIVCALYPNETLHGTPLATDNSHWFTEFYPAVFLYLIPNSNPPKVRTACHTLAQCNSRSWPASQRASVAWRGAPASFRCAPSSSWTEAKILETRRGAWCMLRHPCLGFGVCASAEPLDTLPHVSCCKLVLACCERVLARLVPPSLCRQGLEAAPSLFYAATAR